MPRKPRQEEAGALHHVYARGVAQRTIFRDDEDRRWYLTLLASTVETYGWHCLAYCLMGNHMHLLLETPQPNLGAGMKWFHGVYSQDFNRRYGLTGHVFESRYQSIRVTTDAYFVTVAAYIANNPAEAGLCARPEEWPWGSHRAMLRGQGDRPSWLAADRLLAYFGAFGGDPLRRYVELVGGPGEDGPPTAPRR